MSYYQNSTNNESGRGRRANSTGGRGNWQNRSPHRFNNDGYDQRSFNKFRDNEARQEKHRFPRRNNFNSRHNTSHCAQRYNGNNLQSNNTWSSKSAQLATSNTTSEVTSSKPISSQSKHTETNSNINPFMPSVSSFSEPKEVIYQPTHNIKQEKIELKDNKSINLAKESRNLKDRKTMEPPKNKKKNSDSSSSSSSSEEDTSKRNRKEALKLVAAAAKIQSSESSSSSSESSCEDKVPNTKNITEDLSNSKQENSQTTPKKKNKSKDKSKTTEKLEEDIVCLGNLEKKYNLVNEDDNDDVANPKEIKKTCKVATNKCMLCDKKGHTSFECQMICKNCNGLYHNLRSCPKPPNISVMLQSFMEFCMHQLHQFNPAEKFTMAPTVTLLDAAINNASSISTPLGSASNLSRHNKLKRKKKKAKESKKYMKKKRKSADSDDSSNDSDENDEDEGTTENTTERESASDNISSSEEDSTTKRKQKLSKLGKYMSGAFPSHMGVNANIPFTNLAAYNPMLFSQMMHSTFPAAFNFKPLDKF